jgi:hypothetical protein
MKIPFVGPSGEARSLNQNAERTVNAYLEQNPAPGREWALYGMPGKVLRATFPTSPVRSCIGGGLTYWVAGNTVYTLDPADDYAMVTLGTIGTSSGKVGMADNGGQVLIVDGTGGWLAAASLDPIVDVDFPTGVTVALFLDGYYLVLGQPGSQQFFWNETPGIGTAWNALDFASSEGIPDALVDGLVDGRNLWLFGTHSTELWRNTGDTAAPFQRVDGVFIDHGIAARGTAAKMDNSVFWLAGGYTGDGIVLRSNGSAPQRVSTHAMETAINGYGTISDAFAYSMQIAGHSFYVLTFPSADVTWVYDAATNNWVEWAWRDPAANTLHRDRSSCFVFTTRKHLVGDWETGKVYSLELGTYTDNGDAMLFLRRTQALTDENTRLFYEETVIDMETGVANADCADPQLMYRYSNDGGHTWSTEKQRSIGAVGQYGQRVKFGPTGSGRNRVHEISITDPVKRAVFGAFARVSKGD